MRRILSFGGIRLISGSGFFFQSLIIRHFEERIPDQRCYGNTEQNQKEERNSADQKSVIGAGVTHGIVMVGL